MLEIIIYGLIWCFAIYGIMVMVLEIIHMKIKDKIEDNVSIIMTVRNVENEIENYIREVMYKDTFNNITIIDLDSSDDTMCILRALEKENSSIKVYNKKDGNEFLRNQLV